MRIKRMVFLILLCLCLCANLAYAKNWVLAKRSDFMGFTVYIDIDNIVKNADTVIYWELWEFDEPGASRCKKNLCRTEAKISIPRRTRNLESYSYDSSNQEIERSTEPEEWEDIDPSNLSNTFIDIALKYAK